MGGARIRWGRAWNTRVIRLRTLVVSRVSKVPVSQVPVSQVPVSQVPSSNVPVSNVPVSKVPVSRVPVSNVPVSNVPVSNVLVSKFPVSNVPVSRVPVSNVPVSNVPVSKNPHKIGLKKPVESKSKSIQCTSAYELRWCMSRVSNVRHLRWYGEWLLVPVLVSLMVIFFNSQYGKDRK